MPTAATDVGDLRAGAQPLGQAVDHRKDDIDQRRVEHLSALLRHQRVEARVLAVGESTAGAEASDDLLFDLGQQRYELGDAGEVVRSGRAREHGSALAWQEVCLPGRRRIRRSARPPRRPATRARSVRTGLRHRRSGRWWRAAVRPSCRTDGFGGRSTSGSTGWRCRPRRRCVRRTLGSIPRQRPGAHRLSSWLKTVGRRDNNRNGSKLCNFGSHEMVQMM